MKDFSYWERYDGLSEGSGRSEKVWLINPDTLQTGLFKFRKTEYTTDHISECIAYELAQSIGLPCAKFELGQYKGRQGSISYNILQNQNEILIEGVNYINQAYPDYDADKCMDLANNYAYSLEMIKQAIKGVIEFADFLRIPIFDYIIGNSDRHQNNWGILIKNGKRMLSPLYDNSSSLCAYISKDKIKEYLGNDNVKWKSLVCTKSKSLIRCCLYDTKRPTHLYVMQYLKNNYYNETVDFVKNIVSAVDTQCIYNILHTYEDEGLGREKTLVLQKYLSEKINVLRQLYFGKEKIHE